MSRLDRFRDAQNSSDAGFESALDELRRGRKSGHWIWYIFPQIAGLGTSDAARTFALEGEEEAAEFLRDTELRSRLLTIASAVADQLRTGRTQSLRALMGSDIDARKVVSSLTLFGHGRRQGGIRRPADGITGISGISGISSISGRSRIQDNQTF